jgi:lysophospholipase
MSTFDAPVLILHGAEDQLTKTDGSIMLNEKAKSVDKTLKIYEGLYHEILNEPEQAIVMKDMLDWMEKRM